MSEAALGVSLRELAGHLRLVCTRDDNGRSILREQSAAVPFHLSKSFIENGVLVVNVINPTAGLLRGDLLRSEVRVNAGARLLLTTPSATRVHDTQSGWATVQQNFVVEAGGWLEVLPELFIPQRGARQRQRTRIGVAASGELLYLETLAPGRVASGEIFAFAELDWSTELRHADRLIARERFRLSPHGPSLETLRRFSAHPYVATWFVIAEKLRANSACWQEIAALHGQNLWTASSSLGSGAWIVRVIAKDSPTLRTALAQIRTSLHRAAGWSLPLARKL